MHTQPILKYNTSIALLNNHQHIFCVYVGQTPTAPSKTVSSIYIIDEASLYEYKWMFQGVTGGTLDTLLARWSYLSSSFWSCTPSVTASPPQSQVYVIIVDIFMFAKPNGNFYCILLKFWF